MDSKRPARDRSKSTEKLFALLVLTGASIAASLPAAACNDSKPAPSDAGEGGSTSDGGGAHFW